jgi:hypothetical protein
MTVKALTMPDITSNGTPLQTPTATKSEAPYLVKTRRPNWRDDDLSPVLDHYMSVFARVSALIG